MGPRIKLEASDHLKHPFRAHNLLSDFELEDVWWVPVALKRTDSLESFLKHFWETSDQLMRKGLPGLLFRVRFTLGRWLNWDEKVIHDRLIPGTIRHRYAQQENLRYEDLPNSGSGSFVPVYQLENEFLAEIENSTVHAAIHLGRVPSGPGTWSVQMAVYVRPKGLFGRLYMLLIKPFRLWIVYPSLMKSVGRRWERDRIR